MLENLVVGEEAAIEAPSRIRHVVPGGSAAPLSPPGGDPPRSGCCLLEQLVVRGDDVLDLRTVLRLLQAQSVDQDALVGYRRGDPLELGKLASRGDDLFQDLGGLEALWAQAVEGREQFSRLVSLGYLYRKRYISMHIASELHRNIEPLKPHVVPEHPRALGGARFVGASGGHFRGR